MFLYDFILNAVIFLVIFNIGRAVSWFRTRQWLGGNPAYSIFLPLGLAFLLTVVDDIRLGFAYQLAIFLLGALGVYWLAAQLGRRSRW
ncbi:MAG: hypothetical protein HPY50_01095 [Firmicutes bacterium]|nr:hypothetical protein [Bacillota bacterium]